MFSRLAHKLKWTHFFVFFAFFTFFVPMTRYSFELPSASQLRRPHSLRFVMRDYFLHGDTGVFATTLLLQR
jgi:hypothetical protein